MKTTFVPMTSSGKLAAVLSLAFIILISLKMNGTMLYLLLPLLP